MGSEVKTKKHVEILDVLLRWRKGRHILMERMGTSYVHRGEGGVGKDDSIGFAFPTQEKEVRVEGMVVNTLVTG